MAKVIITSYLEQKINNKLKGESVNVFELVLSLEDNPKKGKEVGCVGKTVIKEIKYKVYRFYFITDGFEIKFLKNEELTELLIKFVRMSNKDNQKKVIDEIKVVLRKLGAEGF